MATDKSHWLIPSLELIQIVSWGSMFYIMYGIRNGIMAIVCGTLPVESYGRKAYGAISGAMATPVCWAIRCITLLQHRGDYPGAIAALIAIAATGAILFFFATAAIRPQSEPISQ